MEAHRPGASALKASPLLGGGLQELSQSTNTQQRETEQFRQSRASSNTEGEGNNALKAQIKAVYERSKAAPRSPKAVHPVPSKGSGPVKTSNDQNVDNYKKHPKQALSQAEMQKQSFFFKAQALSSAPPQAAPPNSVDITDTNSYRNKENKQPNSEAVKQQIPSCFSEAPPMPSDPLQTVPLKPVSAANINNDQSRDDKPDGAKQPHVQDVKHQTQPSLSQTSEALPVSFQKASSNPFAFVNHTTEGRSTRQPQAKPGFSSTFKKLTSSDAGLGFQFNQLKMDSSNVADNFESDMQFLHGETENTSLSDVLTAPIFTRPVQRHLHADTTYEDKPFAQHGLLAGVVDSSLPDPRLFFNVAAPSSTFICGSQGSGKSHTLSCMLENCLLPSVVNTLPRPLTGIVFHYDTFVSDSGGSPCEAAFLSSNIGVKVRVLCAPTNVGHIKRIYSKLERVTVEPLRINEADLNTQRMLDLMAVSSVQGSLPLYLHVVVRILRDLRIDQQTKGTAFDYSEFKRRLDNEALTDGQLAPLQQRLETLESFMVLEQAKAYNMFGRGPNPKSQTTKKGTKSMRSLGGNTWDPQAGQLTIVDLSCPCVTSEMACSLFGICLSLFLEQNTKVGRVVALDEAHKYMTDSAESLALTESLLSTIRLQRHIATRVVVSTQEPTISPRLLDLCSVTIVHRFTSPDWMLALKKHLAGASSWLDSDGLDDLDVFGDNNIQTVRETGIRPLRLREKDMVAELFSKIVRLRTGEALMFAPSAVIDLESPVKCLDPPTENTDRETLFSFGQSQGASLFASSEKKESESKVISLGNGVLKIRIRKRVTKDGGRSIMAA